VFQRILALSPHTDDAELGCGGTLSRFIEEGKDVYYVALSSCEKSIPDSYRMDILRKEVEEATKILGLPEENLLVLGYEVRHFPRMRQEILDTLIRIRDKYKPDLVLTPSLHDLHQDHKTTTEEALRAFRTSSILGYELPWNNITFDTLAFVLLEERHVKKKIEALKCYQSQSHRKYLNEEYITSLARSRGVQIGKEYAEVFEVMRWII